MKSAAYKRVEHLWNNAINQGKQGFSVTMKKTGEVYDVKKYNTVVGGESFYIFKNNNVYARDISNLADLAECLVAIGNRD